MQITTNDVYSLTSILNHIFKIFFFVKTNKIIFHVSLNKEIIISVYFMIEFHSLHNHSALILIINVYFFIYTFLCKDDCLVFINK